MASQEDVNMADEEPPSPGPFSEEHAPAQDPETVHVDQQLAAISKSPTITPAAGIGNRKGIMRAGYAMAEGLGHAVEAAAPYVGAGLGAVAQGASDLFGGPDLGMSIAHAAAAGPATFHPQSEIPADSPLGRARGGTHPHAIEEAAAARKAPPGSTSYADEVAAQNRQPVARPGTGHVYGEADLMREHTQGPSRGGYMAPKVEDVAYMPDSVLEEARNRSQLEDITTPRGSISPSQEQAIEFETRKGEIKYAAMEKLIDDDHARIVAQIMSDTRAANPAWKATALNKAANEAMQTKLENRRLGMAGWPRGRMGLEGEYLTEPMPAMPPGRLGQ